MLDDIDCRLLELLQNNSNISTKELAREVNLSQTPVYERVRRLEREGYIKQYVALLNAEKLNLGFSVYCHVRLSRQTAKDAHEFIEIIKKVEEVTECYSMSGSTDYLLKIHAPDMAYYRRFVLEVLGNIEAVGSMESQFVMSEVKHTTCLPLSQLSE
ncbi:MAG: Lrp/AsnC family transcriptional regulator [Bacteroides sp.]|nr:Lrp/AsnC family transcriptional regulator [Bacteroides sp.]MDE7189396.1 Lrp/AsnC family transcriptional regulator [Muribaculaceae bacterium]